MSGSLKSPQAHRANKPSNTTPRPYNAEVADETNPCMAMIMGNAFHKGHTLIRDHRLRRDEKSEGLQEYPEEIIQCHEVFVRSVRACSEASVGVVHGLPVRERMMRQKSCDRAVLPLWGEKGRVNHSGA